MRGGSVFQSEVRTHTPRSSLGLSFWKNKAPGSLGCLPASRRFSNWFILARVAALPAPSHPAHVCLSICVLRPPPPPAAAISPLGREDIQARGRQGWPRAGPRSRRGQGQLWPRARSLGAPSPHSKLPAVGSGPRLAHKQKEAWGAPLSRTLTLCTAGKTDSSGGCCPRPVPPCSRLEAAGPGEQRLLPRPHL